MGVAVDEQSLNKFKRHIVTRQSPDISDRIREMMMAKFGVKTSSCTKQFRRLWWGFCGIIVGWLWQLRNQSIFNGLRYKSAETINFLWAQSRAQLDTVASYEKQQPSTREDGMRLQLCIQCVFDTSPAPRPTARRYSASEQLYSQEDPDPHLISRIRYYIVANS